MSEKNFLSGDELSILCEQIALILRGGLPMHDGVEALCQGYKSTRYAEAFDKLSETVLMSGSLYEGLKDAGIFPKYMLEMTQIGEKTGELDNVMEGLSKYYSNEARNQRSIRSAIFYPLLLIVMMAVLIGVLIAQVLPIFDDVFSSFAGNSGAASWMNIAMNAGKVVLIVAGVLIILFLGLLIALKLDKSQTVKQWLTKTLPPIRKLNQKLNATRFASSLAMMMRSGYPLDQSLEMMKGLFTDKEMQEKMTKCYDMVSEGQDFADTVEKLEIFEPLHNRMIHMGSKAGQTDHVMGTLADLYSEELDNQINHLVSIIEPTLVALMSLIIGAILLAVMLPLLSVMGSI